MSMTILQELGLSPNEAKIYHALLRYGGSGIASAALRAAVHRRNAYDAVQRLLEKGLVFEVYGKRETVYEAVDPGKLMEVLEEKERKLQATLPELQRLYQEKKAPELAYIFKGTEGVKNYLREALRTGEDMYILGAEGAWMDPRIANYAQWFLREAKKKRMRLHVLFDHDARELPAMIRKMAHTSKFLPPAYDTHSTMDIFGDYVVTYTGTAPGRLLENVTIFVLYSPALAESYRTWWKCLWNLLPR